MGCGVDELVKVWRGNRESMDACPAVERGAAELGRGGGAIPIVMVITMRQASRRPGTAVTRGGITVNSPSA